MQHFSSATRRTFQPPFTNASDDENKRFKELEREIFDLKIANRGKDYLIDELNKERKSFFDQLLDANRTVGQLETKMKSLERPQD